VFVADTSTGATPHFIYILMVAIYLVTAEAMKRWLYRGHFDQQL
jgi:hypothetical protein